MSTDQTTDQTSDQTTEAKQKRKRPLPTHDVATCNAVFAEFSDKHENLDEAAEAILAEYSISKQIYRWLALNWIKDSIEALRHPEEDEEPDDDVIAGSTGNGPSGPSQEHFDMTDQTNDTAETKLLTALRACQEALKAHHHEIHMSDAEAAAIGDGNLLSSEEIDALQEKGYEQAKRAAVQFERAFPNAVLALLHQMIQWSSVDFEELLTDAVNSNPELRRDLQRVLDNTEDEDADA